MIYFKPKIIKKAFFFCFASLLAVNNIYSQNTVNSLQGLLPYLNDDNVDVKLAPGTYNVSRDDVDNGIYGEFLSGDIIGDQYSILLFEGNNSTYDFTGVTINIDTEVQSAFGNVKFHELQIIGNNNVLQNLTLVDSGDESNHPGRSATSIVIDGENNLIEGFDVTIKGSTPYGYGDIFGKGGGPVISHKKHSACLVRGNSNHVKDCSFYHRAYGHGIFFQGANDPYIEGCYVEGELRTVADVLAERGTGSAADNVDFLTVWGYKLDELDENYRFSLQEDGIRSYNAGETIIDGVEYSRGVSGATVIDCTVVNMRSGVTIGWASGTKYVENCTALACESGFWVGGNTEVVNSRGDASVGPLLSEDVRRSGSTIELTLLDNHVSKIGNTPSIYWAGSNYDLTIYDGTTSVDSDIEFLLGGQRFGHRWLEGSVQEPPNFLAENITFKNHTPYPIILADNAINNVITSCAEVIDNGTDNRVTISSDCQNLDGCINYVTSLEAECHDEMFGIQNQENNSGGESVAFVEDQDWIKFNNIDLTGTHSLKAIASSGNSGGEIEVYMDALDGDLLGTISIPNTSGWNNYETFTSNVSTISGIHDVYFKFTGDAGFLLNLDWLGFETISQTLTLLEDLNDIEDTNKVIVYPNPFSTEINVSLNHKEGGSIKIMDLKGQLLTSEIMKAGFVKINSLNHLNTGVYLLQVIDANGQITEVKKLVKIN